MLILSVDLFNRKSGTVIAMALTGQEPRAGFPLTLELPISNVPNRSWVKISQIRTLAIIKAVEVACALALPKDIIMKIER